MLRRMVVVLDLNWTQPGIDSKVSDLTLNNAAFRLTDKSARPMSVSEEVVLKSGETTSAVRLPFEMGGGYLAWAEVNHQLHCLNLMRKAIYWDYYVNITREFQRDSFEVYGHLGKLHLSCCCRQIVSKLTC